MGMHMQNKDLLDQRARHLKVINDYNVEIEDGRAAINNSLAMPLLEEQVQGVDDAVGQWEPQPPPRETMVSPNLRVQDVHPVANQDFANSGLRSASATSPQGPVGEPLASRPGR